MNTNNYSLPELGWRPVLQMQLSLKDLEIGLLARVIAVHRSQLLVLSEQGELQVPLTGVLTDEDPESRASTGDWLLLDRVNLKPLRLLERTNAIKRQAAGTEVRTQMIAANIDTLFLVTSCNQDFNLSRLERYLSIALNARIPAVIVLTKADLCPPEEADKLKDQATKLSSDVPVLSLDAHSSSVPEIFSAWTGRGETIAFLGSSGVGKSTLTNQLTGQFSQKTNQIREQDAKGRHTTTERSMHRIPGGGWILDTPGMREIKLGADAGGIAELFEDIEQLLTRCRFSDCRHQGDAGCAVDSALATGTLNVRRWQNYQKLMAESEMSRLSKLEQKRKKENWGKQIAKLTRDVKKRKRPDG